MGIKKILIIDDDEDVSLLIRTKMNQEGHFHVEVANSGALGLNIAKKYKPDLIVLDQMMPGMTGIQVLKKLKNEIETMSTPVIMLTGKESEELEAEASYSYCEKYLVKPIDTSELIEEINKILARF